MNATEEAMVIDMLRFVTGKLLQLGVERLAPEAAERAKTACAAPNSHITFMLEVPGPNVRCYLNGEELLFKLEGARVDDVAQTKAKVVSISSAGEA